MHIINIYDYYAKLDGLSSDAKIFTNITISEGKNSIVRFQNKNVKPYRRHDTFSNHMPSGSQTCKICGLVKVH